MIEKMPPTGPRKTVATWEHIINDAKIINRMNIALCCVACNASKGAKKLSDWIGSSYCQKKGIHKDTVAEIIKYAYPVDSPWPNFGEYILKLLSFEKIFPHQGHLLDNKSHIYAPLRESRGYAYNKKCTKKGIAMPCTRPVTWRVIAGVSDE